MNKSLVLVRLTSFVVLSLFLPFLPPRPTSLDPTVGALLSGESFPRVSNSSFVLPFLVFILILVVGGCQWLLLLGVSRIRETLFILCEHAREVRKVLKSDFSSPETVYLFVCSYPTVAMVLTRAQRRKLRADGAHASMAEVYNQNMVIYLSDEELETGVGVDDRIIDGNHDLNKEVDPINSACGEYVEEQLAKDILHMLVVEVGDFNACVEFPNFKEGIPDWINGLFDKYSSEEEGFGENELVEEYFAKDTESGGPEPDYIGPFCTGCYSDIEVINHSDDD